MCGSNTERNSANQLHLLQVCIAWRRMNRTLRAVEVRVGRRRHVPRIPSGIVTGFCHRTFRRQLGLVGILVGIQSSQSFFIRRSQLLSITCTPRRSRQVRGTEQCCSWKRKLLPFSEKEALKDPTSYQQHTPPMDYYSQSRLQRGSAEERKMTSHARPCVLSISLRRSRDATSQLCPGS